VVAISCVACFSNPIVTTSFTAVQIIAALPRGASPELGGCSAAPLPAPDDFVAVDGAH
jgi:hypothetical protein